MSKRMEESQPTLKSPPRLLSESEVAELVDKVKAGMKNERNAE